MTARFRVRKLIGLLGYCDFGIGMIFYALFSVMKKIISFLLWLVFLNASTNEIYQLILRTNFCILSVHQ
jgi:hypothetical protein